MVGLLGGFGEFGDSFSFYGVFKWKEFNPNTVCTADDLRSIWGVFSTCL